MLFIGAALPDNEFLLRITPIPHPVVTAST